jgi:membrane associated rhomboid family serine protease
MSNDNPDRISWDEMPVAPPPEGGQSLSPQHRLGEFRRTLVELTPHVFVTPALLTVNVAVFVGMVASGAHLMEPTIDSLLRWGANFGPKTTAGEWWRLLTSTFVHIGLLHLLLNMWVLWDVGCLVERMVGNVGFLVLYLVSGLMGSLASLVWNPFLVSAGASGAIFGVYGALLGLLLRGRGSIPTEVLAGLRNSGLGFLGFNILYGLTQSGIDQAAHVGGLGAGFLCGLVLGQALTPAAKAGRARRNVALAAGGLVAVVGGGFFLLGVHQNVGAFGTELEGFERVEKEVLATFNSAVEKARKQQLSDPEMADILERQMLPPWRAARERFEAIGPLPAAHQQRITTLREYMKLRQEGWELLAQAARENNLQKANMANAKQAAAEALARKLNGK